MRPRSSRTSALAPGPPATFRGAPESPEGELRRERVTGGVMTLPESIVRREPSEHDMRRKRPPAFSLLLRLSTARRVARVFTLLALDLAGTALAIFTALLLKAVVRKHVQLDDAMHETERILAFAYLLTALLFARSGLYAERSQRPGLSRIVGSLFQVTVVALVFAIVNGEHFSSYYLF